MRYSIALIVLLFTPLFLQAEQYKSEDYFYSLDFPETWSLKKQRSKGIFYKNESDTAFIETVVTAVEDYTGDLQQHFDDFAHRYSMEGKSEESEFCRMTARRGTLSFSYQGDDFTIDLIAFKDNYFYYLVMGYAYTQSYTNDKNEITTILESMKIYYDDGVVYGNKQNVPIETYTFNLDREDQAKRTLTLSKKELQESIKEMDLIMETGIYSYFNINTNADNDYSFTFWKKFYQEIFMKNHNRVTPFVDYFKKEAATNNWSSYELATEVISTIQRIPYERPYNIVKNKSASHALDFFTPHQLSFYNTGDCDTKSMLIIMILRRLGYDACMLFSFTYAHAMVGLNISAQGDYVDFKNNKYYFVESTYPGWNIGDLPPQMKDVSKWRFIPIN